MMRSVGTAISLGSELEGRLESGIAAAQGWLLAEQKAAGFWQAPLEANVGMDAQYVIFNRFMGRSRESVERRLAEHMLANQSADGSWPLYHDGPGHLSTTIEAYFALKLTGLEAGDAPLRRARDFVLASGGLARAGVFTRTFLAYFGQFPWSGLPAMPVELILLPPQFPLNIYAMSSWARETVVPLTVLMARRPEIALDPAHAVSELWLSPPRPRDLAFARSPELLTWRNFFLVLDRTLKLLGRSRWKPLRARAMVRAERWILAHQDRNGGWGGIQPPMINCVMALRALGYSDDHPAVARGIQAIDDFLIENEGHLLFQPCVSPTWDTALAAKALLDSGLAADHPALVRAAEWLITNQVFEPGDWQIYNPDLEPGGWAFEFANDWYPDVDDSAVILMALKRIRMPGSARAAKERAIARGMCWTLGMQSRNGGFGAFDTNNGAAFLNEIPFADMKAMIDPPTEDLTGRVLELMGSSGFDSEFGRARRAREFLLATQRPDGSWWGRWGANFLYGTWSALCGLRAIGDPTEAGHMRRAVAWIKRQQNADGGWGETLGSYDDASLAGSGRSTASQTAWAILGLIAGEKRLGQEAIAGIGYLLETQQADGRWAERSFTGTGFPGHFYLRYCMYASYFPLMALGQARDLLAGRRIGRIAPTASSSMSIEPPPGSRQTEGEARGD
ncbi:MAG TPA: squalene--hopene cyclase [Candidatus Bathyarchaeia archaeon]|nr:squalene--hopene cyclase [Candidatus Bathyarchaeia archaeon]